MWYITAHAVTAQIRNQVYFRFMLINLGGWRERLSETRRDVDSEYPYGVLRTLLLWS